MLPCPNISKLTTVSLLVTALRRRLKVPHWKCLVLSILRIGEAFICAGRRSADCLSTPKAYILANRWAIGTVFLAAAIGGLLPPRFFLPFRLFQVTIRSGPFARPLIYIRRLYKGLAEGLVIRRKNYFCCWAEHAMMVRNLLDTTLEYLLSSQAGDFPMPAWDILGV